MQGNTCHHEIAVTGVGSLQTSDGFWENARDVGRDSNTVLHCMYVSTSFIVIFFSSFIFYVDIYRYIRNISSSYFLCASPEAPFRTAGRSKTTIRTRDNLWSILKPGTNDHGCAKYIISIDTQIRTMSRDHMSPRHSLVPGRCSPPLPPTT